MDCGDSFSDFFQETHIGGAVSPEDIFSLLESLDGEALQFPPLDVDAAARQEEETGLGSSQKSASSSTIFLESENELEEASPKSKRQKVSTSARDSSEEEQAAHGGEDGQQKAASHITVERNRRKQMNEHLSVLRSLMPCFYVKRGDQASIIGGVVDYITELQQVLQSLEAKKQRKVIYNEVISPRVIPSPRPSTLALSPRKPPLSPRIMNNLPISPRTPTPTSPYKPRPLPIMQQQSGGGIGGGYLSPTTNLSTSTMILDPSPCNSSSTTTSSVDIANELVANSKSAVADVEVKFAGANVLLKTVSPRIQGQVVKIMSAIDDLSLEILHVNISTIDETMINSFTIKIGIECRLSAEELAHRIQQTFCS